MSASTLGTISFVILGVAFAVGLLAFALVLAAAASVRLAIRDLDAEDDA